MQIRGCGRAVGLATIVAVGVGGQVTLGAGAASAIPRCQSTAAPAGYTVDVCLTVPEGVLTGTQQVTATATVTPAGAVGVDRVVFSGNGADLLADHDPDATGYAMTLRTERLPNGTASLAARAVLTDRVVARSADVAATVANSGPPPATAPFTPRLGSPPRPGERFRVAVVGDGVDGSPASIAVASQVASWQPDVFAYLGDVYDRGTAQEFDTWYGDPSGYGRFAPITNPTVGNHEYQTDPAAAPYFAFWGGVPHFYSYDVAGWHVIVLDSTVEFNQLTPGTPQYNWLVADLAANRGRCMLSYLHHPRYSGVAGVGREGLSAVWSLLTDSGVSMMLAGHAHTYERWTPLSRAGVADPSGMTQFIVGTGGREILNPKVPDARIAADFTLPGALRLDLGAADAAFAFVGADGAVRDSGTVPCRAPTAPPDTAAPTTPRGVSATPLSPTSATVSWRPATDDVGVAGYTVRRRGGTAVNLPPTATTFRNRGLAAGRRYSWTVEAVDAAGNRSPASPSATANTPVSSRVLLSRLRRAREHPAGYRSARFPAWTDADKDRCVTAAEVLIEEAVRKPAVRARCALRGGRWVSPYDGATRTRAGRLAVDHLVGLSEAWQSGAFRWKRASRRQLANDLGYPSTLVAVSRKAARAKHGREPQRWMPRRSYRCSYAAQWVAVKWRWHLAVDPGERRFLVRTLQGCHWPAVPAPSRPHIAR